jgi:hypothetical protein
MTLANSENPFRNPLQRICCGIQKAAYDSKNGQMQLSAGAWVNNVYRTQSLNHQE